MALSGATAHIDFGPQQLHAVSYETGNTAHWTLFVPSQRGDPWGMWIHIGTDGTRSGKGNGKLQEDPTTIPRSDYAKRVILLPNAEASLDQVREAAKECFEGFKYNIVLENCQTFVIKLLERLHQKYPSQVSADAVQLLKSRGTTSTAIQSLLNRNPEVQGQTPSSPAAAPAQRFAPDWANWIMVYKSCARQPKAWTQHWTYWRSNAHRTNADPMVKSKRVLCY